MIQDDVKILTELIRIVNRYGPDSVTDLANRIKDPQYAADLAAALENAVAGASRTKVRAKSRSTNRVGIKLLNELRAHTKIAFLLIKRSWQPTLSVAFDLNSEEESHGHQDPFAGSALAHPGRLVASDRADTRTG